MPLYGNRYYRELARELFPHYSDKGIEELLEDSRARDFIETYYRDSRGLEDRGQRTEDKGSIALPLLGRKLRLIERRKLENGQKSRTQDETER